MRSVLGAVVGRLLFVWIRRPRYGLDIKKSEMDRQMDGWNGCITALMDIYVLS